VRKATITVTQKCAVCGTKLQEAVFKCSFCGCPDLKPIEPEELALTKYLSPE
jgi:hypothetical protein